MFTVKAGGPAKQNSKYLQLKVALYHRILLHEPKKTIMENLVIACVAFYLNMVRTNEDNIEIPEKMKKCHIIMYQDKQVDIQISS